MTLTPALLQFTLAVLVWIGLLGGLIILKKFGRPTTVTLLPYQGGILYSEGYPVRDVGAGKYRVWAGTQILIHGDVRPITVSFDQLIVGLSDGQVALYGFSATAEVTEVRKAFYSARNYPDIPPSVLLRCARKHLSASSVKSLHLEKDSVSERISEDAGKRLSSAGFKLTAFRITRLAVGSPKTGRA